MHGSTSEKSYLNMQSAFFVFVVAGWRVIGRAPESLAAVAVVALCLLQIIAALVPQPVAFTGLAGCFLGLQLFIMPVMQLASANEEKPLLLELAELVRQQAKPPMACENQQMQELDSGEKTSGMLAVAAETADWRCLSEWTCLGLVQP